MEYVNVSIKCPYCGQELFKARMSMVMSNEIIYLEDKFFDIESEIEFDSHDPEKARVLCECGKGFEFVDSNPFEHRLS